MISDTIMPLLSSIKQILAERWTLQNKVHTMMVFRRNIKKTNMDSGYRTNDVPMITFSPTKKKRFEKQHLYCNKPKVPPQHCSSQRGRMKSLVIAVSSTCFRQVSLVSSVPGPGSVTTRAVPGLTTAPSVT